MDRDELGDLMAFSVIAEEGSFTRAAARLGTSQSALSLLMRRLEARRGVRLLMRTTRSVSTTAAGEQLLSTLRPALGDIERQLDALSAFRDTPAGRFRITAGQHAIETVLWPKLSPFLKQHPDIEVELIAEAALTDIVAERFDAGVRLGEQVEKDMIAVRIAPPARMIVVGSPHYLAAHGTPAHPNELTSHQCINIRLPSYGGFYAWELSKNDEDLRVRVKGQVAFSSLTHVVQAAIEGFGLAFVHASLVRMAIAEGRLVQLLDDWCPEFPGYHLYYPSRRNNSPAFKLLVETLREP